MIPSRIPQSAGAFILLIASYLSTSTTVVRAAENAPCYYPGGQPALGFYPCQAFDAPVSSCCPAGWTCFSNRLCVATTNSNSYPNLTLGAVQRGACTNPKWDNEFCGGACLGRKIKLHFVSQLCLLGLPLKLPDFTREKLTFFPTGQKTPTTPTAN